MPPATLRNVKALAGGQFLDPDALESLLPFRYSSLVVESVALKVFIVGWVKVAQ